MEVKNETLFIKGIYHSMQLNLIFMHKLHYIFFANLNRYVIVLQGREILQSTVDLVQNNLNLEVISSLS